MKTFVFGDMHGRHDSLASLLEAADIIDGEGNRISDDPVVSIGDLINLTLMDIRNDEEIVKKSDEWVDVWILGNHEAPLYIKHLTFDGQSPSPVLQSAVNRRIMEGKIVPCVALGNTLLTHAGVIKGFDFKTVDAAADAIFDVFYRYNHYALTAAGGFTTYTGHFDFGRYGMPKAMLLDGVGEERGGRGEGGILWSDWDEPKNANFNQVVGHTPLKEGPVKIDNDGTWTLNIDSAAKKGLVPSGVWLDEEGQIIEIVTPHKEDPADSFFGNSDDIEFEQIPAVDP